MSILFIYKIENFKSIGDVTSTTSCTEASL